MRYVVYGAGAVGGVIGARLHLAGRPTTLIARGEHLARIRADGLRLVTGDGEEVARTPATDTAADVDWSAGPNGTHDTVVLLCVKGQQTAAALDDILAHAPAGTPVVCVQNGVANEREMLRRTAATYAVCVVLPATHLEPGVVVQDSSPTPGVLEIGRYPRGTDSVTEAVAADLRAAGFLAEDRADVMAWKYRKLLMNLGNGVDAAYVQGEATTELEDRARREGEEILAASGVDVVSAEQEQERRGDHLQRGGTERGGGSTWQSVNRGTGSVEVDYLSGEIVLLARLHGLAAPVNSAVQAAVWDLVRTGGQARSLDATQELERLDAG